MFCEFPLLEAKVRK